MRLNIFIGSMITVFCMVVVGTFVSRGMLPVLAQGRQASKEASLGKSVLPDVREKLRSPANTFSLSHGDVGEATVTGDAAYTVVDFDSGKVLLEKDGQKPRPIASLTKVMTAVVALDLASPTDMFTVSEQSASVTPTTMGVVAGEKLSLPALFAGLLMTSANDAAGVLQEGIDRMYGEGTFVWAMNEKAKLLGLVNTKFDNPQGFDGDNFSTSEDLALLSHYALSYYPLIAQIGKKDYQFIERAIPKRWFDLYNFNGLLGVYPGVFGLKIGNTSDAGYTTVVVSERDGKRVLVVLLGADSVLERDLFAAELLDRGFGKLGVAPANITQEQLKAKYATWKFFH